MTTFFSAVYCILVAFEACIVVLMLLAIFTTLRTDILPFFLENVRSMTKFGVLKQWIISTACVVAVWLLSGLSINWLLVSFALDMITVPATLWFIKISKYNPAASESLVG